MRLPNAAFTINEPAIHTNSGLTGTIAGIRRHPQEETLQYLFDCSAFKQWLTVGKLDKVKVNEASKNNDEDGEIEYKQFKVYRLFISEVETVVVSVKLPNSNLYERSFNSGAIKKADTLYDFIQAQDAISEIFLTTVGLEKV